MAVDFVAGGNTYTNTAIGVTGYPITIHCQHSPDDGSFAFLVNINDASAGANRLATLGLDFGAGGEVNATSEDSGGGSTSATSATVNTGAYNAIGGVWVSTTSRTAWLNGTAATTETTSRTPTGIDQGIIGNSGGATPNGPFGELGIWNAALNDNEMISLSKGVSPLLVRPTSLVHYIPFNQAEAQDAIAGIVWTASGSLSAVAHPPMSRPSVQILQSPPAAVGGTTPKGPLGHPFFGPFAGPVAA